MFPFGRRIISDLGLDFGLEDTVMMIAVQQVYRSFFLCYKEKRLAVDEITCC